MRGAATFSTRGTRLGCNLLMRRCASARVDACSLGRRAIRHGIRTSLDGLHAGLPPSRTQDPRFPEQNQATNVLPVGAEPVRHNAGFRVVQQRERSADCIQNPVAELLWQRASRLVRTSVHLAAQNGLGGVHDVVRRPIMRPRCLPPPVVPGGGSILAS